MTFKINHKVDGSYILACIEGSNNRYNRYKTVEVTFNFGKFSFAKNIGYTRSGAFGLETPVMEEKECENVCFKFNSPNELQKLIDAIDIQSAKNELQNRHGNIENVDSLFK